MTRTELINHLKETLEPLFFVHALWLEGADALGSVDAFSDVDLWLDVQDGYEDIALNAVRRSLEKLGELELDYDALHPDPLLCQHFFRLAKGSK